MIGKVPVKKFGNVMPDFFFKTKTRKSDRPENGFGKQIINLSFQDGGMRDLMTNNLESDYHEQLILCEIDILIFTLRGEENLELRSEYFRTIMKVYEEDKMLKHEDVELLCQLFDQMKGELNNFGHHRLLKELRRVVRESFPKVTLQVYYNDLVKFFANFIKKIESSASINFFPEPLRVIFSMSSFLEELNKDGFLSLVTKILNVPERSDLAFHFESSVVEAHIGLIMYLSEEGYYYKLIHEYVFNNGGEEAELNYLEDFNRNIISNVVLQSLRDQMLRVKLRQLYYIIGKTKLLPGEQEEVKKMIVQIGFEISETQKQRKIFKKTAEAKIREFISKYQSILYDAHLISYLGVPLKKIETDSQ